MKLRKLNDLILECSEVKKFKPGCLASILEDRMADLIVHGTIDSVEEFIDLVLFDIQCDKLIEGTPLREYASPNRV